MTLRTHTIRLENIGVDDADAGLELSTRVGWNQSLADWRLLLTMGSALGAKTRAGTLIGTAVLHAVPPYAWLSMVLVHPDFRRQGIANRLVDAALGFATGPVALDATEAGRSLYASKGFLTSCTVHRMIRPGRRAPIAGTQAALPMRAATVNDVLAADLSTFGADRSEILRSLYRRLSNIAFQENVGITAPPAYCFGRRGIRTTQIGPIVADTAESPVRLVRSALARRTGPMAVDVLAEKTRFVERLLQLGFSSSRSFERMVLGAEHPPGCGTSIFASAGPELG